MQVILTGLGLATERIDSDKQSVIAVSVLRPSGLKYSMCPLLQLSAPVSVLRPSGLKYFCFQIQLAGISLGLATERIEMNKQFANC